MELIALEQDRPNQRQLLKQLISQHSANAQFIVWYHVIVHIKYFLLSCKVIRQSLWKLACPSGTCGFGPSPIQDLMRDQNPNYLRPKYKKLPKKFSFFKHFEILWLRGRNTNFWTDSSFVRTGHVAAWTGTATLISHQQSGRQVHMNSTFWRGDIFFLYFQMPCLVKSPDPTWSRRLWTSTSSNGASLRAGRRWSLIY